MNADLTIAKKLDLICRTYLDGQINVTDLRRQLVFAIQSAREGDLVVLANHLKHLSGE